MWPTLTILTSVLLTQYAQAQYVWYEYNGHRYALTQSRGDWLTAETEAIAAGGHLATIDDAQENTWLTSTFPYPISFAWIGYHQGGAGTWTWISGQPVTYTNHHWAFPQGGTHAYLHVGNHPDPGTWNAHDIHDGPTGPLGIIEVEPGACYRWALRSQGGAPPRSHFAFAYDSRRHVAVLFGGHGNGIHGDTWEWNGEKWDVRTVAGPSPRMCPAMCYDADRNVCVLFGGWNNSPSYSDTWEWDGQAWTLRSTAGPGGRHWHQLVYDSNRHVTVLFGGLNEDSVYLSDTWEWNGTEWTLRSEAGPSVRCNFGMAYDSARRLTVLHGGWISSGMPDTWEWDGATWTLRGYGPGLAGIAMAYDPLQRLTILSGGWNGGFSSGTWEWNGQKWTSVGTVQPPSRRVHGMVYDTFRRKMVMFGGEGEERLLGDTWELSVGCDSCGTDRDGDGWIDDCDNCPMSANPDQADCDHDGKGDACAIADGLSQDCNSNSIPDNCDDGDTSAGPWTIRVVDASANDVGTLLRWTLIVSSPADPISTDCNTNVIPDECESDQDGDGVVDDCDLCEKTRLGTRVTEDGCPACSTGDFDCDGDVDAADLDAFMSCVNGPLYPILAGCDLTDLDLDEDVDQSDFAILQRCLVGQDNPLDPSCSH